jgi:predicted DNA-binding protein (UPF0251 family)/DNA-directed RNA polymerase subunit RPC12/RpoP
MSIPYIITSIFSRYAVTIVARPKKERRVLQPPAVAFYKPQGIPLVHLQRVVLNVDEFEAIRLVDYESLDQEEAAKRLGVSRPTCARIVEDAHKKIAEAITQGKAIQIEGGKFVLLRNLMRCSDCGQVWETVIENEKEDASKENEETLQCPQCSSIRIIDLGKAVGGMRGPGWRHQSRGRMGGRGREWQERS